MLDRPETRTGLWVTLALVVAAGLAVRVLLLPPDYVRPIIDELGYTSDGLLLLEGVTPGYKFAPGAVTAWTAAAFGAVTSLAYLFNPEVIAHSSSVLIRPLVALDTALFDLYADMSGVRLALQLVTLVLSMLGVTAAWYLGRHQAGWPGALLAGGLMAITPVIAHQSVLARPYGGSWALGLMAVSAAVVARPGRRVWLTGICLGLAVASRIEMVLLTPLVVWGFWASDRPPRSILPVLKTAAIAVTSFLVAAPWFLPHFIGNVRKIVTVKLLRGVGWDSTTFAAALGVEGWGVIVALIVIGLALQRTEKRWLTLGAAVLFGVTIANFLRPTFTGLRHQGDFIVLTVVLSGYALSGIRWRLRSVAREGLISGALVALILTIPAFRVVDSIRETRAGWVKHDVVRWVETHVPPGSPVFLQGDITYGPTKVPLPTEASADRIWAEVAHIDAWRQNFDRRLADTTIDVDYVPRALSMEHMYQRVGGERRYFILAGQHAPERPRFELYSGPGEPVESPAMQRFLDRFEEVGGVFVHFGEPVARLGVPVTSWIAPDASGVFVYRRPVYAGSGPEAGS